MTQNDRSPDTAALYAWLSRDADGVEGIIAVPHVELGIFPLVACDKARALTFQPAAKEAARRRGFPAQLVRFERAAVEVEMA